MRKSGIHFVRCVNERAHHKEGDLLGDDLQYEPYSLQNLLDMITGESSQTQESSLRRQRAPQKRSGGDPLTQDTDAEPLLS